MKISNIPIQIIAISTVVLSSIHIEWRINLDTGIQTYERSILGITIREWSEYNYVECEDSWKNPIPNESGERIISSCYWFFCSKPAVKSEIVQHGCKT